MEPRSPEGAVPQKRRLFTRRQVIAGSAAAFATGVAATAIPRALRNPGPPSGEQQPTQIAQKPPERTPAAATSTPKTEVTKQADPPKNETPEVPIEEPTKVPPTETAAPTEPPQKEQVEADDQMAHRLVRIYGDHMDKTAFRKEGSKLQFMREVTRVAKRLNADNPALARQIAAIIYHESNFSPATNDKRGGTGLIRFGDHMADVAGTTLSQLADMNVMEQLGIVEDYLQKRQQLAVKDGETALDSFSDLYMAVVRPSAVGKDANAIVFDEKKPELYDEHKRLDRNKNGQTTKQEAVISVVEKAIKAGESLDDLWSIKERVRDARPDREMMEQLVANNTDVIQNPLDHGVDPNYLLSNYNVPWGSGWCLMGVRKTVESLFPEFTALGPTPDNPGPGSAYLAADILASRPDLFTEVYVEREELKRLPEGTVFVHDKNVDTQETKEKGINTSYDFVDGAHHGHISVLRNNDGDVGSDHIGNLDHDLTLLHHGVRAFLIRR